MSSHLIEQLENLNFNKVEAKVYVELVKSCELNGSQIAKKLNISRSSVYSALNNLYSRGVVFLLPGDTNQYRAENPKTLFQKLRSNFEETTKNIEEELLRLSTKVEEKMFYNLSGTNNFISKAKELLMLAKSEVYINTCIDLNVFKSEFQALHDKGVRIIAFTFDSESYAELPIEIYSHPVNDSTDSNEKDEIRLMIVVDLEHTLICSKKDELEEMNGVFTTNDLMASIVAEHIHHDIYLLKLKNRSPTELIDEEIRINTLLEGINEDPTD